MAESSSSAIPEAAKATPTANPPVQNSQITMEMEGDRAEVMGDRMVRAIGGGSPETPPSKFAGALGQVGGSSQAGMLRQLQRTYGNSYVGRVIQAKLTVGEPGDLYEQEADRVADAVMRMSESTVSGVLSHSNSIQPMPIQRMRTEEEEEKIHPKESPGQTPTVTPVLETRLDGTRGGGEPLPESVRSYMGPRFGADFSGVRVHTGSNAIQMNRDLNAQAFTRQRDIYFGAGRYSPETRDGQRLLAHELTHVVQQDSSTSVPRVQRKGLEDQFRQYEESDWEDADDHLVFASIGSEWVLLPGSGILVRPSKQTLDAASTVRGRLGDQGIIMGVPATGASASRFIRISHRLALQLDAGRGSRVTAALYMDQVHGIMGRMGVSKISQLRIIHIHRDHISEIAAIAREFNLSPQSIVIPQEFMRGRVRRDLQGAITELRGLGGDWTTWSPGTVARNLSGTNQYTLSRTTHGEITVEYLSLNSAMETLATGTRVTAPEVDRASFITRVTRRSDLARVITLGDVRFSDLELFRRAMGTQRFNEFFQDVTTINGFSHHAGQLEARDIQGLMAFLEATMMRSGRLPVMEQTDPSRHGQVRTDTIELMQRLGIEVAISRRAMSEGEGSSGVLATRDTLTAYGSHATVFSPIESPLTQAFGRVRELQSAKMTILAWREVFEGRGMNVEQTISEIDASVESLRISIRTAAEAAARVRASGITTASGGRDYTSGSIGVAYQQALSRIPATTTAETNIGLAGFATLQEYRQRSLEQAPQQVALEAALREGTYSDQAFSYMLSQLDPTTRNSILYGRRGGPRPRDVAFERLRARYLFLRRVLPDGHTLSLAGMSSGRARITRGVGGLLAFVELSNIGAEGYRSYQIDRNISRRRHVAPFLRRLIWWNQMGVMPRVEAVEEGLFSNEYSSDPPTVIQGLNNDRWDGLWFPHNSSNPALPDSQVLRLGVFLAQNIRNYDEFSSYFIDSNQDAVRWVGEGGFAKKRWEMKVGSYKTDWENETMERWEEIPLLTQLMQTYVNNIIVNTEKLLEMQGRGAAPSEQEPDPRLGGLAVASFAPSQGVRRARMRSPQSSSKVYVRSHGRHVRLLSIEVEWWSDNPQFYIYREVGNRYLVGGADYNTYSVLRRLTTENTQLMIGGSYGQTWEETTIVPLEEGLVEIDKNLLKQIP